MSPGLSCSHMKVQGSRTADGINDYSSRSHIEFSHSLVWRWVQRYAPEINTRMRTHLKMSGISYRLDETYVKVGTEWKYLYRAVDSTGQTAEFMLSCNKSI